MYFKKESLGAIAEGIVAYLKERGLDSEAVILALSGDLGAGKTALVQHIAGALGVTQTPPSPTFVIMRSYETADQIFKTLVHIDAYRIEEVSELRPLHLDSVFKMKNTLVCIEWPEKIKEALPKGVLQITLMSVSENERELKTEREFEKTLQKLV